MDLLEDNYLPDELAKLKNNRYSELIVMKKLRNEKRMKNLCYADLNDYEKGEFDKRVKSFEKNNPIPARYHDIGLQQMFYEKTGVFGKMNDKQIKSLFKERKKINGYYRSKRNEKE